MSTITQDWRLPSPDTTEVASIDARIARLAATQHGVVARRQLAGVASASIAARVADGRFVRLHRGVYAVTHTALRPEAFRLAAVLACGDDAVLSHRSAGEAWGLCVNGRSRHEVTSPSGGGRTLKSVEVRRASLHVEDRRLLDGVPLTSPARTLLDLAAVLPAARLAKALERAEALRLFDLVGLQAVLGRAHRRAGTARLRAALRAYAPEPAFTRSELERIALMFARRYRLPQPVVNCEHLGEELDFFWPAAGLNVECDGWETHRTRAAYERDRRRDRRLQAAGVRVVRVTAAQLRHEPAQVAADLRALLAR